MIWAPRPGVAVNSPTIALRGFVCRNAGLILVQNRTTAKGQMVETTPLCRGSDCIYTFATYVRNLAPGLNQLTASTPDGAMEISLEVVRSALAEFNQGESGISP